MTDKKIFTFIHVSTHSSPFTIKDEVFHIQDAIKFKELHIEPEPFLYQISETTPKELYYYKITVHTTPTTTLEAFTKSLKNVVWPCLIDEL